MLASRLHSGWIAGWKCYASIVSICVEAFYIGGEECEALELPWLQRSVLKIPNIK